MSNADFNEARAQAAAQQAQAAAEVNQGYWDPAELARAKDTYVAGRTDTKSVDVIERERMVQLHDRQRVLDAKLATIDHFKAQWTEERDRIVAILGQVNEAS